jgi:hypothetical protein
MNNAMLGMQGTMSMEKEDSLRDLIGGANEGRMLGTMDSFDDDGQQLDDNDDFNADALLMSPIFNDSVERLNDVDFNESDFGQFEASRTPPQDSLLGQPLERAHIPPKTMDHASLSTMQRPYRPAIVRESRTVKIPSVGNGIQGIDMGMGMTMMNQGQHIQSNYGGYNSNMGCFDGNFHGMPLSQVTNDSTYLETSQSDMQDYSMQSYPSQTRRMQESSFLSSTFRSESGSPSVGRSNSSMYQPVQRSMVSPTRALPPKAQSYAGHHHHMSSSQQTHDLDAMRQQIQELRELEVREAMQRSQGHQANRSGSNLSQSMHMPVQRTSSANASMSQSMHFESGNNGYPGMSAPSPSFSGGNNVSIASDTRSFKHSIGGIDAPTAAGTSNVNEAMEKLCESMKRSAMSRSLIKQYSSSGGRSGVSRHGSGPLYAMRQATGRNAMDDSSSGRGAPIRRPSNTKYQLQHPVRGVNRHTSAGANGGPAINFQIDGRHMGM